MLGAKRHFAYLNKRCHDSHIEHAYAAFLIKLDKTARDSQCDQVEVQCDMGSLCSSFDRQLCYSIVGDKTPTPWCGAFLAGDMDWHPRE